MEKTDTALEAVGVGKFTIPMLELILISWAETAATMHSENRRTPFCQESRSGAAK